MLKENLKRKPISLIPKKSVLIDSKFINELAQSNLTFDMHFILNTLKEKSIELFNSYNDIRPISQLIYQYLHREDYIKTNIPKYELYSIDNVQLSIKGLELFKEDVDGWIKEWRELWPKGITSGGYPVRSDLAGITKKMRAFLRKTNYSKEEIILATKLYLKERYENNWSFMKLAGYFIEKDGDSVLASFCERIREGETIEDDPFVTKV